MAVFGLECSSLFQWETRRTPAKGTPIQTVHGCQKGSIEIGLSYLSELTQVVFIEVKTCMEAL